MSISGLGSSLNSVLSQYNFESMTNQQFFNAVQELGKEGKISKTDTDQLSFIAQGVDSVPITGASRSVAQILSDPTKHDFISELQGDDDSANTQGASGGALYDEMLKAVQDLVSGQSDGSETKKQSLRNAEIKQLDIKLLDPATDSTIHGFE